MSIINNSKPHVHLISSTQMEKQWNTLYMEKLRNSVEKCHLIVKVWEWVWVANSAGDLLRTLILLMNTFLYWTQDQCQLAHGRKQVQKIKPW